VEHIIHGVLNLVTGLWSLAGRYPALSPISEILAPHWKLTFSKHHCQFRPMPMTIGESGD
jgi:hypothetical protein